MMLCWFEVDNGQYFASVLNFASLIHHRFIRKLEVFMVYPRTYVCQGGEANLTQQLDFENSVLKQKCNSF